MIESSLLPNIYDFIAHTYPFSLLSTLEQDTLAASVKISYYTKDDVLADESLSGVGLFMIRTGAAEQINKDGTLRARLGVGDSFGYTQLNKQGASDYKVCFLENTLIYLISRQILEFIKSRNAAVGRYFDGREYVRLNSSHHYLNEGDGYLNSRLKQSTASCCRPLVSIRPQETIEQCARRLKQRGSELAVVQDEEQLLGVITKSDIALRAVAEGLPCTLPVSAIMSPRPVIIEGSKPLYQALESMLLHNVQNLPVVENGTVIGTISTRDLLQNSLLQPLYLMKEIARQDSVDDLIKLSAQKGEIFSTLMQLKVQPRTIQRILSKLADAFIKKICALIQDECTAPPCAFAFFAAGSLAREEVQFLSDQDNGIVFEREVNAAERSWFKDYALKVCTALDKCGFTWCSGNYMACNEKWCQSYQRWQQYYDQWILEPDQKALLDISVFLDLRCEFGDEFLITKLKQHLLKNAAENSRFLALLCSNATAVSPPLGLFRQFVLTRDGQNKAVLNIKNQGISLISELARLYALQAKCLQNNTYLRLEQALDDKAAAQDLAEAYTFLNDVRFAHQFKALQAGQELSNFLPPAELSQFERNHLKDAFRIIARQQSAAQLRFGKGIR